MAVAILSRRRGNKDLSCFRHQGFDDIRSENDDGSGDARRDFPLTINVPLHAFQKMFVNMYMLHSIGTQHRQRELSESLSLSSRESALRKYTVLHVGRGSRGQRAARPGRISGDALRSLRVARPPAVPPTGCRCARTPLEPSPSLLRTSAVRNNPPHHRRAARLAGMVCAHGWAHGLDCTGERG